MIATLRNHRLTSILSLFLMLALAACAGLGCSGSDSSPAPASSVGPEGGLVAVSAGPMAGASVSVPPGAIATGQTAVISLTAGSAVAASGTQAVGPAIVLGPAGLVFLSPVTVTIPFNLASLPTGTTTSDIRVLKQDSTSVQILTPFAVSPSGTVSVQVMSFSTFQAAALVPPANQAPIAVNDTATTSQGQTVSINVLANDSDPDGDSIALTAVGAPSSGAAVISGGTVQYTPAAGFTGTATFTYTITDARLATAQGSVTVTVLPIDDGVVAVAVAPLSVAPGASVMIAITLSPTATVTAGSIDGSLVGGASQMALTKQGAGNTWTVSVDVSETVAVGSYGLSFSFTQGTTTISGTAFLTVVDAPSGPGGIFQLTILHNNDGESKLLNAGTGLASFGGAARFVSKMRQLRTKARNEGREVIALTSGDNFLAGSIFSASQARGVPFYDSIVMDQAEYDAICIGNHDFDFGPDVLADFMIGITSSPPFLSANLDFAAEPRLQALVDQGRLAKRTVIVRNGQRIGIVGATTPLLPSISSPRGVVTNANVAQLVQAEVDALEAEGVNKIILISHLQNINEDIALAAQLRGVDVMIAGGGDELLANSGDALVPGDALNPANPYPRTTTDANNKTVYVVTTAGDYKYVGALNVSFDADGEVISLDSGSGPKRVAGLPNNDAVAEDPYVRAFVTDSVQSDLAALAANTIANSEVELDGRRATVRTREANQGNLAADAQLWKAQKLAANFNVDTPVIGLQNGGGIRNNFIVPAGNYSELSSFDALPFANFISVVENVSPLQLKRLLERAVSGYPGEAGQFAQISGFRMIFDPTAAAFAMTGNFSDGNAVVTNEGSRIWEVQLEDGTYIVQNGVVATGAPSIAVCTIDFLARGGDNYPFFSWGTGGQQTPNSNMPFTTLGVTYQRALYDYITSNDVSPTATGLTGLAGTISAAKYTRLGTGRIAMRNVAINRIQGAAHKSPLEGVNVYNVEGIVTAVGQGSTSLRRTVYIQTVPGMEDTSIATSEALVYFAFSATHGLQQGDRVRVSGIVTEFYPGGESTGGLSITEIVQPNSEAKWASTLVSSGQPLPAPIVIGTGGRVLPTQNIDNDANGNVEVSGTFDFATDAIDFWESLEHMHVRVTDAVAISGTRSFGEVGVLANNGTGADPRTSKGGIHIDLANNDFNPEIIIVEANEVGTVANTTQRTVPAYITGDTFPGNIDGVVDWAFGKFQVRPYGVLPTVVPVSFNAPTTTLTGTATQVTVATYNVLNMNPNSANIPGVAAQIVNNMLAPDIIGLQEIQDDNGTTNNGVTSGTATGAALIAAINAIPGAHVNQYAYSEIAPINNEDGGAPGSNIRCAFLYRVDRVSLVTRGNAGPSDTPVIVNNNGKAELSLSPARVSPNDPVWAADANIGYEGSRKPLAAEFTFLPTGAKLIVINNHLKSKSQDQPLFGRNQPPILTTEPQRIAQGEAIQEFVSSILAVEPTANVVVLGDLNEFEDRPTTNALAGNNLTNLITKMPADSAYTYNFNGNSQTLDHIFVANGLATTAQAETLLLSADLSDSARASDHNPVLARLTPSVGPTALNVGDVSVIGFRSDDADGFAFVAWTYISPGTVVSFTDNGFNGTSFGTTENTVSWTAPAAGIAPGTVVTANVSGGSMTFNHGTGTGALSGLSTSGDQIFVFQGSLNGGDMRLVFGLNFGNSGWLTTGTSTTNTSYLPAELNVTGGNFNAGATSTNDNGQYTGARTGQASLMLYRDLILNAANWTFEDTGSTVLNGAAFTAP